MASERERIYDLLAPSVQALGYELLGVQVARGSKRATVRLYIDSERGISLDDCERVSHQVSGVLDVEDPVPGEYVLEVSSPGLDRPLFSRQHFEDFAGEHVRVRMSLPVQGRRNFAGRLTGVDGDAIVLEDGDQRWRLPLEQIGQARLAPKAANDGEKLPGSRRPARPRPKRTRAT